MALKTACFCLSPRTGTLMFLYIFLIDSVVMFMYLKGTFAPKNNSMKSVLTKDEYGFFVISADAFIVLMGVFFIAAIIYINSVSYEKHSISLLSSSITSLGLVRVVLILELIVKTSADICYTENYDNHFLVQLDFIKIIFRILITLYAVMIIHGFTIELKYQGNSVALPPVQFVNQ